MPKPLTTTELRERLARRVLGPDGQGGRAFLLEEVQLGDRRADAISIGLWPSRGQLIEGYEYKVTRRDWVAELEDHQKAEPLMAIADHMWLVTNPDVLQPGELPERWGLLLSNGRGRNLKVEKPAPKLRNGDEPPVGREALVRLLRRVQQLGIEEREGIYEQARKEAEEARGFDRESFERQEERQGRERQRHMDAWHAFHGALGLRPYEWQPTPDDLALLGKIASAIREGEQGLQRLHDEIRRMESTGGDLVGKLNDAMQLVNDHIYGKGQAV